VAGDLSSFVGQQLVTLTPHHYKELVDVHAGIHSDLAAKVVFELLLLHTSGRVVTEKGSEPLDTHAVECLYVWCDALLNGHAL
jgi:hypothetical protein